MFDLSAYHILLATMGVVIVVAHWLPRFVSGREPAAAALLMLTGYAAFAFVPGMPPALSPLAAPVLWEHLSELCVIVGLFGVGLRIDRLAGLRIWIPTIRLLALAMPVTIVAMAGLGLWLGGLSLAGALLLGAVLAPTDPVLAADVQVGRPTEGGEHPVRFALTAEAGLNDGLAFPFVHLAVLLAAAGVASAEMLAEWALRDGIYRIAIGAGLGIAIGKVLGFILFDVPRDSPLAETESGVIAFAGVLVAYGVTELAEGYGFIAAFVGGLTLRRSESHHAFHARLHDFSEALERALTAILLVGLGAALPVTLVELDLRGAGVAILLLFVIRPVAGWLSLSGAMADRRERFVVASYGIRGIGSIYYLSYASGKMPATDQPTLWAIVSFTIFVSTVVHGFTAGYAVERATGGETRRPGAPQT